METPSKEEGNGTSYEGTYKFYEALGFELERVEKKEIRPEKCDMAILKKVLK